MYLVASTSGYYIEAPKNTNLCSYCFWKSCSHQCPLFSMNRQNLDLQLHAPKISVLLLSNLNLSPLHAFKMLCLSFMHNWHQAVPTCFKVSIIFPFQMISTSKFSLMNRLTSRELEKLIQCFAKW